MWHGHSSSSDKDQVSAETGSKEARLWDGLLAGPPWPRPSILILCQPRRVDSRQNAQHLVGIQSMLLPPESMNEWADLSTSILHSATVQLVVPALLVGSVLPGLSFLVPVSTWLQGEQRSAWPLPCAKWQDE